MAFSGQDESRDDSSDWEYEYLDNETETFYINLDLTTCNGPLRVPKKRSASTSLENPRTAPAGEPPTSPRAASFRDDEEEAGSGSDQDAEKEQGQGQGQGNGEEHIAQDENEHEVERDHAIDDDEDQEQIQIMDFHSANPIISYRNQIFSCEWADLIGTEMVFMHPEGHISDLERLRQTEKYDLLSTNSVKLLGRKASLISTTHSRFKNTATTATGAKQPSNQARFFERLKELKRAKGENDTIRTTIPSRKYSALYHLSTDGAAHQLNDTAESSAMGEGASAPPTASSIAAATSRQEKIKAWARTGQQLAEVEGLKRRAMQGDEEAVTALENIMARTVERAAAEARAEEQR